jgi:RNA polymerase sigma factor (sigma-70 family)
MVSSPTIPVPAPEFPADALATFQTTRSEDAFHALVRHYYPMIFATALRRSEGNRGLAEDAAQLVLIDLARKARGLRPATLGGWLHRHTCFTTSKLLRSERRRSSREKKAAADSPASFHDSSAPSVDDLLLGLPETDRHILLLRHVDGQSHDDIARRLGLTPAAAKKRSERALQKLRERLRDPSVSDSRFAGLLVPPLTQASGPQVETAATKALAAPAGSPFAGWLSHPVAGAALGSAAALILFAAPLAAVFSPPSPDQGISNKQPIAPTTPWKSLPGALPDYRSPASPAEAVERLLEIARTRGLEGESQRHAGAIAVDLPAAWRHEVMLGLAENAPPGLTATSWFDETMRVLAARWQPRELPADLRALLPLVRDRNGRRNLAKASANFDLPATLALIEVFPADPALARDPEAAAILREDLQTGIMTAIAATDDGKAAIAYYFTLPAVRRSDGTTRVAQQEFLMGLRASPALQRSVWENLAGLSSSDLQHMLLMLENNSHGIPDVDLPPLARAQLEARRVSQSIPHDNKSPLPMEDVLDAWEAAVPADLRLEVASYAWFRHPPTYLALARRLGEENGGAEFDALRLRVIGDQTYTLDHLVPPDDLFAMAARIRNPEGRFQARQNLLRRCGDPEKAVVYLQKYIPEAERAIQRLLLVSENRQYPD